jgi:(p)ppGpp synthase/HD superfamily hydrolase
MWDSEVYKKALQFAAVAHRNQKVPGGDIPYITHVVQVCQEVMSAYLQGPSFDVNLSIQCALLHDTIEDTEVRFPQILAEFGAAVAHGVLALTKDSALDKSLQMADSLKRLRKQPPEVGLVKLCDRIENLSEPPVYWKRDKCQRYLVEAQEIVDQLGPCNTYLKQRLEQRILEYPNFFAGRK